MKEDTTIPVSYTHLLCDLKGEHVGMREMRGHAAWYVKGLPKSHQLKDSLTKMDTYAQMEEILCAYEKVYQEYIDSYVPSQR